MCHLKAHQRVTLSHKRNFSEEGSYTADPVICIFKQAANHSGPPLLGGVNLTYEDEGHPCPPEADNWHFGESKRAMGRSSFFAASRC